MLFASSAANYNRNSRECAPKTLIIQTLLLVRLRGVVVSDLQKRMRTKKKRSQQKRSLQVNQKTNLTINLEIHPSNLKGSLCSKLMSSLVRVLEFYPRFHPAGQTQTNLKYSLRSHMWKCSSLKLTKREFLGEKGTRNNIENIRTC